MAGFGSHGPRTKRNRPVMVSRMPRPTPKPRLTSSVGSSRTGRTKEHIVSPSLNSVSLAFISPAVLCTQKPRRTTAQGSKRGDGSGVAPIRGQALARRRAGRFSPPRHLTEASIRELNNQAHLLSPASHIYRHITLHSRVCYGPPSLANHRLRPPSPSAKPPALHLPPLLRPPPPSHPVQRLPCLRLQQAHPKHPAHRPNHLPSQWSRLRRHDSLPS